MARAIYQYQPINETPDVAVGILLPMDKSSAAYSTELIAISGSALAPGYHYDSGKKGGSSVFAQSYSTEEQAISNLKNLLLTFKGERFMQPDFGTHIRESVFKQNTREMADYLKETLTADIARWLPYIVVNDIIIIRHIDAHTIDIQVNFRVGLTGANLTINIMATENEIIITSITPDTSPSTLIQVDSFGIG